jgi:hypothetical protein
MFIISSFISLNNKLLAYSFSGNSGISDTASGAGISTAPTIESIIGTIISSALGLLGVAFLILTIYGGIMWMTAEGDEAKVEKARKIITDGAIGLIVILAAYAISFFIFNALGQK